MKKNFKCSKSMNELVVNTAEEFLKKYILKEEKRKYMGVNGEPDAGFW